ncbi:MAG: hypothetical protein ABL890_03815 [Candidatus Peribacteraceae bacterium]
MTDIIFNLIATNILVDENSFEVYNKADSSVTSPCYVLDHTPGSPQYLLACWDAAAAVNTEIDQGTDATFVLRGDILNAKVDPTKSSALQVSLQNFNDTELVGMAANLSHIRWLDKDSGGSTEFWWIDYPETTVNGTTYNS